MNLNSCQRCGSLNLRADRALAGRIICANCGTPFSKKSYSLNKSLFNNITFKKVILLLAIFAIFIIILG